MKAEDFVFIPYMGRTREDRWLATNGDWYLGINANITDETVLRACRLYLEYVASTEFAPEYYSASVPVGATTYYRRDDTLNYDYFQNTHPEFYQCLTEHSIVKNPYQFYGSDLFTFALRHYLCGQNYYAGLEGASSYMKIGGTEGDAGGAGRIPHNREKPLPGTGPCGRETDKTYNYVRMNFPAPMNQLWETCWLMPCASTRAQIWPPSMQEL